ncbi:RICIN domain-containing protein [Streptomyces sp. NPDC058290]|uniref:RICIN domain-containing protein n=1 Tax=Streptomyces sp. NPDC058290 TaxID=3346426 RepID=UPI0036E400DC
MNGPYAVAVDGTGVVYIADAENHRVRKVVADGTISTVAGTGEAAFGGDGGAAEAAQLNHPVAVAVDSADCVHICDQYNHRVRKVAADGTISTVAGTGEADCGGDDGPAGSAQLNNPFGLALNGVDALYIADHINNRIRKIASPRLPKSGAVVGWANARSRLRMAVARESTKDGAEIHQTLPVPRGHQRWRLVVVGQDDGEALYRIENVRSGKALEVVGGQEWPGAVVAQRAYEGDGAHHQQWRLIPVGSAADAPHVYEIANRNSGLYLRADTNARTAIRQDGAEGNDQGRQWQLLPA